MSHRPRLPQNNAPEEHFQQTVDAASFEVRPWAKIYESHRLEESPCAFLSELAPSTYGVAQQEGVEASLREAIHRPEGISRIISGLIIGCPLRNEHVSQRGSW